MPQPLTPVALPDVAARMERYELAAFIQDARSVMSDPQVEHQTLNALLAHTPGAGGLDGGAPAGGTLSGKGLDIPMNSARNGFDPQAVEAIATRLRAQPGALMLVLREVQDRLGWVPAASVPVIAQVLNLSRAEVHGVVTFYHDFRHEPPGHNVLRLCQAESCQAMGAGALAEHACRSLGIGFGETTPDREFTLEAVYCLGNCGCSPAMLLNGEPYGRLTPERLDDLLAECRENRR